jgi:serine/threonine protein kinase
MGAVYLVSDSRLSGKMWAVKEMSDSGLPDPAEKQRAVKAFRQEALLLASLSHPNLTKVVDYFEDRGKQYLVMDYVEGHALDDMMVGHSTPFPETQVLEWAEQLCNVLSYLHHQKPPVIFRDLKPGNIMLDKNGCIRLIDFGVARFFKPGASKDTVSLGTPGYAAPEQYGKGQSDARSDVYALGATLHHLLTLRDPGDDPFNFPSAISLNSGVSKRVSDAIQKAVNDAPALRWQSAADFAQALKLPVAPILSPLSIAHVPTQKVSQTAVQAPMVKQWPKSVSFQPLNPAPVQPYANNAPRFVAYLIDSFIIAGVSFFIYLPFASSTSKMDLYLFIALLFLFFLLYHTGFHTYKGQTPGKRILNIKVVGKNGERVSWWRALWRTITYVLAPVLVSILCMGVPVGWIIFLWPLVHKEHRALHDILAGTWVIKA